MSHRAIWMWFFCLMGAFLFVWAFMAPTEIKALMRIGGAALAFLFAWQTWRRENDD